MVMSLPGRWGLCFVLWLIATCSALGQYSTAQPRPLGAQVLATGAEIDAIVNSVAIGRKPTFEGRAGEFPIRRTVTLQMPAGLDPKQNYIFVLLEGMVVAQAADNTYADPLQTWQGFKMSTPEHENKMITYHEGVSLQVTLDDMTTAIFPLRDIYTYKAMTRHRTTVSYEEYSFKQNRLLVKIQMPRPLTSLTLTILTTDLETASLGYLGFFRVHLFGPKPDGEVPKEKRQILFEWYDHQKPDAVEVGQPLALGSPADFLYPGDFLCPVGIQFVTDQTAKTSRLLTGLPPGAPVTMEVTGVFLFSGFHAFTKIGGDGGWQDLAYRYDYARFRSSPYFSPVYAILIVPNGRIASTMLTLPETADENAQ